MRTKRTRLEIGLALSAALLMRADLAGAVTTPLTYDSADSSASITHTPGTPSTIAGSTETVASSGTLQTGANKNQLSLNFTPTSSFPSTPSYQFSTTDTIKSGSTVKGTSVAKASVESVTNSTTAAVKIQAGTGVTQGITSATHAFSNPSDLYVYVDEFWTVGSAGAGPGVTGVASFALAASVPTGGSASFSGQFTFYDDSVESEFASSATVGGEGSLQIGFIDLGTTDFTAGTTTKNISASTVIDDIDGGATGLGRLVAGHTIEVVGYIDFTAADDDTTGLSLNGPGGVGTTTDPDHNLDLTDDPAVPEPTTIILSAMGIGSAGLSLLRRRRTRVV